MKLFFLSRRFRRLNVPGALLVALLQRTPVARVVAAAESVLVSSPLGAVLRSAAATVASLGAMHSLAGATPLVPSSGSATGTSTTVGTDVSIAYTVTGTQTPPASWRITGSIPPGLNFSGLTSPGLVNVQTLRFTGAPTTAGTFDVTLQTFEGPNGSLEKSPVYPYRITVSGSSAPVAPAITTQPQSQTVTAGASVNLSVAATGSPTPTYQWRKDGANVSGGTNATLTFASIKTSDAGTYTVVVTNSAGSVTSTGATLTVNSVTSGAPTFTLQPTSQTIATGSTVVFNAAATGATSFRWQRNGADVLGATAATLVINATSAANAGTYTAIAANSGGSVTSTPATLTITTVAASDAGRLSNLSVRTNSGTGDQVLNVGFVIGGGGTSGTKPLLIRVTGPALAGFGVPGTMDDPTLTVQPLASTTVVASNDNWAGSGGVASTSSAVGAFPLTDPGSRDAAVATSLSAGSYTALAAGKNNSTGIVLTEIYDATSSSSITATTPRLINVSARAQVGTGDGVLITGFAVSGSTARTLLIRATGPALAAFGVPGTLADPKLSLAPLGGATLAENDNWGGSAAIATTAASVGAFGVSDTNSKDAMLLVTLPPGGYTATVSGADGGTGVALIEVYEVP